MELALKIKLFMFQNSIRLLENIKGALANAPYEVGFGGGVFCRSGCPLPDDCLNNI